MLQLHMHYCILFSLEENCPQPNESGERSFLRFAGEDFGDRLGFVANERVGDLLPSLILNCHTDARSVLWYVTRFPCVCSVILFYFAKRQVAMG